MRKSSSSSVLLSFESATDKFIQCCVVADKCGYIVGPMELHPGPAIAALMKLSFDEQHRQAVCALGLLFACVHRLS